jgi:hypothetical protein
MVDRHLGFVGVGRMGGAMAGRPIDAGYRLIIYDVNESAMAPLVARGARANVVSRGGRVRNSATQDKFPRCVLPRSFDFGFTLAVLHKDVRLGLDQAVWHSVCPRRSVPRSTRCSCSPWQSRVRMRTSRRSSACSKGGRASKLAGPPDVTRKWLGRLRRE